MVAGSCMTLAKTAVDARLLRATLAPLRQANGHQRLEFDPAASILAAISARHCLSSEQSLPGASHHAAAKKGRSARGRPKSREETLQGDSEQGHCTRLFGGWIDPSCA